MPRASYYSRNSARLYAEDRKRVLFNTALADSYKVGGCVDCGNKNLTVLQFDHVRGAKVKAIANMVHNSVASMLEEIAKCEVRCANCHVIVTSERREPRG